jgi:hypothetical protein
MPIRLTPKAAVCSVLSYECELGWSLYARLHVLLEDFDLIRHIAGDAAHGLQMDESTLTHPVVNAAIIEIDSHGSYWLEERREEMIRRRQTTGQQYSHTPLCGSDHRGRLSRMLK